jgi:hypothetical protein
MITDVCKEIVFLHGMLHQKQEPRNEQNTSSTRTVHRYIENLRSCFEFI